MATCQSTGQGWWNESPVGASVRAENQTDCNLVAIGLDSEQNADDELIGAIRSHQSGGSELMVAYDAQGNRDVVVCKVDNTKSNGWGVLTDGTVHTLGGSQDVVAYDARGNGDGTHVSLTGDHGNRVTDYTSLVAYGVSENQRSELRLTPYSRQITSGGGKPGQGYPCVAFAPGNLMRRAGENPNEHIVGTLGAEKQGDMFPHVGSQYGVRRLTPTECERLQGFPDGWTAGQSDSARYRQLGNAVCVPVAEWIGRRIVTLPERT